ncbi:diguanylate cyclase domain-containing protein [Gordonibacter massiliensis (ex Traore et al. 2017)]|uniref:diguanylate cyclase domain-containing protein n=1 Tax=Gordonibacter massiliensis (ex Traore et al. 2017) TaxID=1841863 RepID=UPI001C8B42D5|nr:diguanylate cyclase [Gordonibacter massiliensis (ex Traore et al. 2017)]MBX9034101.1 diguanylate cyclase [Gordonibacter massiliensis (ex Traore et al. 2017)]
MSDPYEIFDELAEIIYVSDPDTHEMLYVNESARRIVGDWQGRTCYDVVLGRDAPCDFCNIDRLSTDSFLSWTHYNEKYGRHYLLKDKLIEWHGRSARLEMAFDMTAEEERRQALETRLGLETLLVRCAMKLQNIDGFAGDMTSVLKMIGEFLEADRVYLFQVSSDGTSFSNSHEWCAEGVTPQIDELQDMDMSWVTEWMPLFLKRETVIVKDLEDLRETSPSEYEMLAPQGITSLVDAPLLVEGELIGSIGVDNPAAVHLDHCAEFFTSLSYFLSMELERHRAKERFRELSYTDALTGLANRNRFIEDVERLDSDGPRRGFGVIYVDMNGLKDFNDLEGHAKGDQALVAAGRALEEALAGTRVYRMGGDEFLAVVLDASAEGFGALVDTVRERLAQTGCSMAMGLHYAAEPCLVDEAVRRADGAMYEDKRTYYRSHPASARYRE